MALVPDELYISSPSSHRVPCSPHVAPTRGSPAYVPDIDQTFDRLGQFSPVYQRYTSADINSTTPTFLRNPYLNLTETGYVNSFNVGGTPSLSQVSEQVVPSCSPFVSSQRSVPTDLSQRLSQESVPALYQQKQTNENNKNDVPLDEKAPTVVPQETRRQNRTLVVAQNTRERVKQLFDSDDAIFD